MTNFRIFGFKIFSIKITPGNLHIFSDSVGVNVIVVIVKLYNLSDSLSKKTPGNETLIEFELNGKNIMFTPELLSKFSKVFIRREVGSNFELYQNMKMLFVVRDPRSMISARLRFVQSLAARKNQFYAQLQYWYQLNKDLISLCDQYPGKCIIVRYEDLVIRKRLEIEKVL